MYEYGKGRVGGGCVPVIKQTPDALNKLYAIFIHEPLAPLNNTDQEVMNFAIFVYHILSFLSFI